MPLKSTVSSEIISRMNVSYFFLNCFFFFFSNYFVCIFFFLVYESPVIPGTKLPMQTDFNLEKPTDPREDRFTHNNVRDGGGLTGLPEVLAPARPPVQHHVPEQSLYQSMRNVVDMEEDVVEPTVMMGPSSMGLAEDPPSLKNRHEQIPPSNYPTGQGTCAIIIS